MAYATQTHTGSLSLASRLAEVREQAVEAFKMWRLYRATVNELSELSTHELSDLGISRSEINAIAMEATYGQAR